MTKLIEVKTAELSGAALDWAVAVALGWQMVRVPSDIDGKNGGSVLAPPDFSHDFKFPQHGAVPAGFFLRRWSSDWSQGGPLIEKYRVDLSAPPSDSSAAGWDARRDDGELSWINAPTALIAACRAIVAAKLGDVVRVPAELVEGKA